MSPKAVWEPGFFGLDLVIGIVQNDAHNKRPALEDVAMDEIKPQAAETEIKISLAKLMKVKNRLAGRIASVVAEIQAYNCIVKDTESPNVRDLYTKHERMVEQMTKLKVALDDANRAGQRERIYQISEKKSKLAWLRTLNTRHGPQRGYDNEVIEYVAAFRKQEVDEMVRRLEREIDELQDAIDSFNASRKVVVDAELFTMVS